MDGRTTGGSSIIACTIHTCVCEYHGSDRGRSVGVVVHQVFIDVPEHEMGLGSPVAKDGHVLIHA